MTFTKTGTKATSDVTLSKDIFGIEVNSTDLLKKAYLANQARGRHNPAVTKLRGEVRGGGRKPWRQKGTGNARVGSIRSPLWRGGGITFGPTGNENHQIRISKSEKKTATKQALSLKAKDIIVIEGFNITSKPNTKSVAKVLDKIAPNQRLLVALDKPSENTIKSFSNIPNTKLINSVSVNVANILDADKVILSKDALSVLMKNLGDLK